MGMPAGIIDDIGMEGMDIGICAAGFMVTSWLDNERYGQYNRARSAGVSRFGIWRCPQTPQTDMSAAAGSSVTRRSGVSARASAFDPDLPCVSVLNVELTCYPRSYIQKSGNSPNLNRRRRPVMKSSLWFETSMLALILVASVITAAFDETAAHRNSSSVEKAAQAQPERLASGR